jgi:hypothetical protein
MEPIVDPPSLNPKWKEALDKVMHTSLMDKDDDVATLHHEDDDDTVATEEEREQCGDDDDDDDDDDGEEAEEAPPPSPPRPQFVARNVPATFGSVMSSAIPMPTPALEARAEAHRKRVEENRQLQREEKLELLGRLQYFSDEKGFKPFRVLGPDDTLEDIRYEVFRAQREMSKKRNVKMMQKALVTVGAGIEMANSWYNPLQLRLDGFSKSLLLSMREYDDIFEELHWKYCDAIAMPPEMKLVLTLGSSVWFFHMSNPHAPGETTHSTGGTGGGHGGRARGRRGAQTPPGEGEDDDEGFAQPAVPPRPQQRRMNGPRGSGGPMGPVPEMDMASLFNGIGMVQTLMNASV